MILKVNKTTQLKGEIDIPGSKSHTIRAIIIAFLAKGTSKIMNPLYSADTKAAINCCKALGADIKEKDDEIIIIGFDGKPKDPGKPLDTLNSGTTTNLLAGVSALADFPIIINGDPSIQKRPIKPLLDALNDLGAKAASLKGNGCPPIKITGPIKGGKTSLVARSSQYLSSLLISCPLAKDDTQIIVKEICELPYIEMTLHWLKDMDIKLDHSDDYSRFNIPADQRYDSFERSVPADWSSAAFPIVAASVLPGSDILVKGLDIEDSQGDKAIIDYIQKMGGNIDIGKKGIRVRYSELKATELDLNNTPDALPAASILACAAKGTTIIKNVGHARIKETDRIKVMAEQLSRMHADVKETTDGMIIKGTALKATSLKGYEDHRVVMALSLAGMLADGTTTIDTAESTDITFPDYVKKMKKIKANMEVE